MHRLSSRRLRALPGAALLAGLLLAGSAGADDTDLYVDNDRSLPPSSKPWSC